MTAVDDQGLIFAGVAQIFTDVPGRVAKQLLLLLAQQFGTREGDALRMAHDLTQEEIAQLVGAFNDFGVDAPEASISRRMLRRLEDVDNANTAGPSTRKGTWLWCPAWSRTPVVELEARLIELKRRTLRKSKCPVASRGFDAVQVVQTKAVAPQCFLSQSNASVDAVRRAALTCLSARFSFNDCPLHRGGLVCPDSPTSPHGGEVVGSSGERRDFRGHLVAPTSRPTLGVYRHKELGTQLVRDESAVYR